jgi:hypothetical protein
VELVNTKRLRVTWYNLRQHWDAPPLLYGHYRSRDHGMYRHEHTVYLHIFGRGFNVKLRPAQPQNGSEKP